MEKLVCHLLPEKNKKIGLAPFFLGPGALAALLRRSSGAVFNFELPHVTQTCTSTFKISLEILTESFLHGKHRKTRPAPFFQYIGAPGAEILRFKFKFMGQIN